MEKSTHQTNKTISRTGIKLSIVFSFRNEDEALEELVTRVRNVLKSEKEKGVISDHELIFVNDRSTDQSEEHLKKLNQGHGDIKIINMSRTFGVSPCVMTGLKYSTGDAAIYMDSDLQDPPEVIPKMLEAWQQGDNIDIVHTVRTFRAGEPYLKLQITKIGYWILRKTASIDLLAEAGDFKFLSRRVIDHINRLNEYNPFMRGIVAWVGFNQAKVGYKRESRFAGDTKFPIFTRRVISNFFSSALISFSSSPLHWASIIGLAGVLLSFGMLLLALFQGVLGLTLPGWLPVVTAILFIGSVQLLGMGILGLYIQTIFIEVKRRPNYIVDSIFGFSEEELKALREASKKEVHEAYN
jgi:glycosyltransferase involved in cell wall biosynthesis